MNYTKINFISFHFNFNFIQQSHLDKKKINRIKLIFYLRKIFI